MKMARQSIKFALSANIFCRVLWNINTLCQGCCVFNILKWYFAKCKTNILYKYIQTHMCIICLIN